MALCAAVGIFASFFFVAVILFNGLSLAPSAPPSLHLRGGFFSCEGLFFLCVVFFILFWFIRDTREEGEGWLSVLSNPNHLSDLTQFQVIS